jgi:hypothetical protein
LTFSLTTSHPRSLLSIAGRKIPKYQYVGFGFSYRHDPVLYRLNDPTVIDLVGALHRVGERTLAEVREVVGSYFQQRDAMEPVSRKDLAQRLRDGSVTVLDVRPADKFVAGHLPRAINIPLRGIATAAARAPQGARCRRLLPRSILCAGLRSRSPPAQTRFFRAAPRGRLP